MELHRTKSVRLASLALVPEKENDNCQRLRDFQLPDIQLEPCRNGWLLPTIATIASQNGVIPGLVFPQVIKFWTEKELWVFWVLDYMGMQAALNPMSGRFISRSVMS